MAGEYIEFDNNSQPAINDTNLNRLQQLIKQDIQGAVSGDTLPVGAIMPFGSDTIPENWLLCDGQAVSRTIYQDLFNIIGTNYGAGDGFTTFNLPDLKGKIPVGKDENDTDFDTLGETGGEKAHTLTINEMPSHDHDLPYKWSSGNGDHIGSVDGMTTTWAEQKYWEIHTTQKGGNQPHNILQPYIVQNYIIKATQSAGLVATVINNESTSQQDTYSCNYINNLNSPKYMLATITNQQNLSSNSRINLNSVIANVGNKFTLQNNKITIGEGVSRIRVSGAIFVEAPQNTGYVWGQISLSSYRISGCIFPYNNGGGFLSVSIPPTITSCQQGDEIELIGDSIVQGNTRTGKDNTWILVEAIDY